MIGLADHIASGRISIGLTTTIDLSGCRITESPAHRIICGSQFCVFPHTFFDWGKAISTAGLRLCRAIFVSSGDLLHLAGRRGASFKVPRPSLGEGFRVREDSRRRSIEEPCEPKGSSTVLKTSGIGDTLTEFNQAMILCLTRGYSSVGRALQWHCRGQRFEPA